MNLRRIITGSILASISAAIAIRATAGPAQPDYHAVDNWAQLPPGTKWAVMTAVDIDSKGTIYDLQKLKIKNDGYNKSITLPAYVKDVARVVIWCAFAQTNLGEASFKSPVT